MYSKRKKFIKPIFFVIISGLMTSCGRYLYYKKVSANTKDFDFIIGYIQKNEILRPTSTVLLKDSTSIKLNNKCVFETEIKDKLLLDFMKKYDLLKICFSKLPDRYIDSVITFHKNYAPFGGKAITIEYNFGVTHINDSLKKMAHFKGDKIKQINDSYIYFIDPHPAFGQ